MLVIEINVDEYGVWDVEFVYERRSGIRICEKIEALLDKMSFTEFPLPTILAVLTNVDYSFNVLNGPEGLSVSAWR